MTDSLTIDKGQTCGLVKQSRVQSKKQKKTAYYFLLFDAIVQVHSTNYSICFLRRCAPSQSRANPFKHGEPIKSCYDPTHLSTMDMFCELNANEEPTKICYLSIHYCTAVVHNSTTWYDYWHTDY